MTLVLVLFGVTVGFALGALLGAPYLRTHQLQTEVALDLLDLKPGQTLVDLGSGDGSVLLAAAQRGIYGIGYEINPLLYLWSKWRCRHHRGRVRLHLRNYWKVRLPECDGVFVFLVGRYMRRLDRKLARELSTSIRVASYVFEIPGRRAVKERSGVWLYQYNKIK